MESMLTDSTRRIQGNLAFIISKSGPSLFISPVPRSKKPVPMPILPGTWLLPMVSSSSGLVSRLDSVFYMCPAGISKRPEAEILIYLFQVLTKCAPSAPVVAMATMPSYFNTPERIFADMATCSYLRDLSNSAASKALELDYVL